MLRTVHKSWMSLVHRVKSRGYVFRVLFWLFFFGSIIPLVLLLGYSVISLNILLMLASLMLLGIISIEIVTKRLYSLSLMLVVCNFVLWFVMGLIAFTEVFFDRLPGITSYLLLIPYAFISGGMVRQLLLRASKSHEKTLLGGIIVSIMIALVAASTNIIIGLAGRVNEGIVTVEGIVGLRWISDLIGTSYYNPTIGFIIIMIVFNSSFIFTHAIKKKTNNRHLFWYLAPLLIYAFFVFLLS